MDDLPCALDTERVRPLAVEIVVDDAVTRKLFTEPVANRLKGSLAHRFLTCRGSDPNAGGAMRRRDAAS